VLWDVQAAMASSDVQMAVTHQHGRAADTHGNLTRAAFLGPNVQQAASMLPRPTFRREPMFRPLEFAQIARKRRNGRPDRWIFVNSDIRTEQATVVAGRLELRLDAE